MAWTVQSDRYTYRHDDIAPELMPSDREVKSTVVHRLRENPYTEDGRIKVSVHDGVVELDGVVPTPEAEVVAIEDVMSVPGVADVNADLVVRAA
jgi:osmotically-inducible protein OsmY